MIPFCVNCQFHTTDHYRWGHFCQATELGHNPVTGEKIINGCHNLRENNSKTGCGPAGNWFVHKDYDANIHKAFMARVEKGK